MLGHVAAEVARASRGRVPPPKAWRDGVFPAAGDDEWCVVSLRSEADRHALRRAVGAQDEASVGAWIAERSADAAMETLQAAGVAAARMLRVSDLTDFAYYRERGFYRVERHPYLAEPVVAERAHVASEALDDACIAPAPLAGEHTAKVVADWLGLDRSRIAALVASGVLEPVDDETLAAARVGGGAAAEKRQTA
jgi:crotonobetainyl-CoA:carnitine CoA-transferase CaiB-like acyl-CoA transferase